MATPKTWYILKESIPIDHESRLLGAIVQDFRDPLADYVPRGATAAAASNSDDTLTPSNLVPAIARSVDTVETEARTEVEAVRSTSLSSQLFDLLTGSVGRSREDTHVLEASRVQTRKLENHTKLFQELLSKPSVKTALDIMFDSGGTRKAYFVVGLKACSPSRVSRTESASRSTSLGIQAPLDAAIGSPGMLPNMSVGVSGERSSTFSTRREGTLQGDRIFALEYRVVRRDWFGYGSRSWLAAKVEGGRDGGNFFGKHDKDGENDEGSGSDDDDYDGVVDEPLGLVDDAYTAFCLSEDGAHVDKQSGYMFE